MDFTLRVYAPLGNDLLISIWDFIVEGSTLAHHLPAGEGGSRRELQEAVKERGKGVVGYSRRVQLNGDEGREFHFFW